MLNVFKGLNTCIAYSTYVTANSLYTNTTHTQTQHTQCNTHAYTHACMHTAHVRYTCTYERAHTNPRKLHAVAAQV